MGVSFIITTIYAIFSLVLYVVTFYLIVTNRKIFKGSYYIIYHVNSVVNVVTYLNSLLILRLPQNTCKDCALSSFYEMKTFVGLGFSNLLFTHMAYVQYLMITSFILNRLTAVLFPTRYEQFWKKFVVPLMIFNIFSPLVATYEILTVPSFFKFNDANNYYVIATDPVLPAKVAKLVVFMFIVTVVNLILTVVTFFVYKRIRQKPSHQMDFSVETKLIIFSVVHFTAQFLATACVTYSYFGNFVWTTPYTMWGYILLPYVSDALTFASPFVLLACSPTLRVLFYKCVTPKTNQSSIISIVPVTYDNRL